MFILAIDSSASPASAALMNEDRKLLACYYQDTGLTHSTTLLPLIDSLLKNCGVKKSELKAIVVTRGPGSFTGLRIGISTAKGLAVGLGIGCAGVSTLDAMAAQINDREGVAICAMDARRNQVYNANFRLGKACPERLCDDRAIGVSELVDEIRGFEDTIYITGDGADIVAKAMLEAGLDYKIPINCRQSAAGALLAADLSAILPPEDLNPVYIRLSQAERELLERGKNI